MTEQPKSIADVLDAAADLIEPEGAWTQGAGARDLGGNPLVAPHPEAVCWCVFGAIAQIAGMSRERTDMTYKASRALDKNAQFDVVEWQDERGRTQPEVVAKLREAAALARAEGR